MTMKKGPSPALVTPSLIGSGALGLGSAAVVASLPAFFVSTVLAPLATAGAGLGGILASVFGAASAPLTASFAPFLTPGLDFGAGLTRGLQDALTGGDLLTEVLSVLGSGGTTTIVAAPTVAPCPFC